MVGHGMDSSSTDQEKCFNEWLGGSDTTISLPGGSSFVVSTSIISAINDDWSPCLLLYVLICLCIDLFVHCQIEDKKCCIFVS